MITHKCWRAFVVAALAARNRTAEAVTTNHLRDMGNHQGRRRLTLPAQTGRMAGMEPQSIPRPTLRTRADIAAWAAYARYRELASYPGWFLLDVFIPIITAAVPILLGRAAGGADAAMNFSQRAGT